MNRIRHSHIHRLRTRTHVTIACTNCRRLKKKCSGEPVCTNCANRSFECIFVRSGKKRGRKSQKLPCTNGSDVNHISAHEHPSTPNMNNDNNGTYSSVSQNVQGHLTIDPFRFIRNNDRQTPNEH
ncbi:6629_t:CDS:1 [Acaulospora morrowiae]|uniref:6629_t:CDS:1 n=1 Tax=Acaulospora morrowiae TaxID=94023 RepID=A0A9N9CP71_9GLOM|nr:6629_t:CDS:1 [Acaulospora morrowiae]